jgi:hypothetical protein
MGSLRNWFNKVLAPTSRFKFVRDATGRDLGQAAFHQAERNMAARVVNERARTAAQMSQQLGEGRITRGPLEGVKGHVEKASEFEQSEALKILGNRTSSPEEIAHARDILATNATVVPKYFEGMESFGDEIVKLRGLPDRTLLASYANAMQEWRAAGEAVPNNAYIKGFHQEMQRRGLQIPVHDELHLLHEGPGGALNPSELPSMIERTTSEMSTEALSKSLGEVINNPDAGWDPGFLPALKLELRSRGTRPGPPPASPGGALGPLPPIKFLPPGLYGSDIQTLSTDKLRALHGLYSKTKPDIAARIAEELRKRSEGGLGPLPMALAAGTGAAAFSAAQPDEAQAGTFSRKLRRMLDKITGEGEPVRPFWEKPQFDRVAIQTEDGVWHAGPANAIHRQAMEDLQDRGIITETNDIQSVGFRTSDGEFFSADDPTFPAGWAESNKLREKGLLFPAVGAASSYWGGIKQGLGLDDESIGSAVQDAAQRPGGYNTMGALNSWIAQQAEPLVDPEKTLPALLEAVKGFAASPGQHLRAMGSSIKQNPAGALGLGTTMVLPLGGKRHKIALR